MDISTRMPITKVTDLEEYQEIVANIIRCAHQELTAIISRGGSGWNADQLEKVVIPEMVELQQHLLRGELFLKYGKQQRLLESTYILTDSLENLHQTPLGIQLCILQRKMDLQI